MGAGALNGYWAYNLDDRDKYYYRRVYLSCIRANDFLTSLPSWDGKSLVVMGGAINKSNITPSAEFNIWADPEASAVRTQDLERVRQAMELLPPEKREILVFCRFQGMKYDELAGVLHPVPGP